MDRHTELFEQLTDGGCAAPAEEGCQLIRGALVDSREGADLTGNPQRGHLDPDFSSLRPDQLGQEVTFPKQAGDVRHPESLRARHHPFREPGESRTEDRRAGLPVAGKADRHLRGVSPG